MFVGVAVFAGVLGAQQVDHLFSRNQAAQGADLLPMRSTSTPIVKTGFETTAPGTPFDFTFAAKKVSPSVVSVDRYEKVQRDFFDRTGTIAETGQGSGVIVSANGTIVTNNHVVTDERSGEVVDQVKVRLNDDRTFTAKVLGHDARSDLAVLKIDAPNLTPIDLGNSPDVQVGQWVLAVGNPLGFSNTVSAGVVSSLKRNLPIGGQGMVDAIQTDAAINPGNSGGALCNAQGQLIGINSAIASSTGQSVGIGFAIPVDRVKTVVNDIVKLGYARYAGLGISFDPRLEGALADPQAREQLLQLAGGDKAPSSGVIVQTASGSAQSAGIGQYDVILAVDGQKVEGTFDLNKILIPRKPGDKVQVRFWSKGQTKTTSVVLQEIRPERPV
ncbi:serine protease HtrA [Fimbriimonas ginsengisoli Gsoil 348]|uniref:Serine protease HtrA n=1 Tax=Fimbriimonas ginsengisoli Gsoil 348 TaxID=661478 RepID=A0A068NND4_FIMGI|nr:serine protease HtrA [Fimbriimonas ginsengisoli Gsoil 348]